ncbi:type III-B CRISPR-associated protein Cas10/Cmr2 [Halomicronema sp. CCY15110]|uniref:type III-B CRISPR-associated protein Cas10/Cmr2 n=1 Tax=Halomicronema sp. CCY15110 TaxID=2767773 RepID=UPI0019528B1C|nr:type III-B CRISPR-associated protein Cas10/Cmr2 [Halomicronema sp. CCY15110]
MTQLFWQAKIWGLLHDPVLKALHGNPGRGGNSFWRDLTVMQDWVQNGWNPEESGGKALQHIHLADYIASASDRGAVGSISIPINYNEEGLETRHLLSGKSRRLKVSDAAHVKITQPKRGDFLTQLEETLLPEFIQKETDARKVFWWLWRCLPVATCQAFDHDESLLFMPAETRLPDSSIWDHVSITAALAGTLTGFNLKPEDLDRWNEGSQKELPHLVSFTFTPIQELIKASRKMRDFWAGSWILHYLSARVCWALAWQYGPDSILYPSLFQQPLIDHWLLHGLPDTNFDGWKTDFTNWVLEPRHSELLTAGFPNVIVLLLPESKVEAAMQYAKSVLKQEWLRIGNLVFNNLQSEKRWMPNLTKDHKTWGGWLNSQWQTYWSAVPIGDDANDLKTAALDLNRNQELEDWLKTLAELYRVERPQHQKNKEQPEKSEVEYPEALPPFTSEELNFLQEAFKQKQGRFSVNVGSWWSYAFSSTRTALTGAKNARNWVLPTAFGGRSTISGLGPVVHPDSDYVGETTVKKLWQQRAGIFDGSEQLNATEVLKRGLHHVLADLFGLEEDAISAFYPDLTAGVAGYLKTCKDKDKKDHLQHFINTCHAVNQAIQSEKGRLNQSLGQSWGIPWIDADEQVRLQPYHSRLLNAGWLFEEIESPDIQKLEDHIRSEQDSRIVHELQQNLAAIRRGYRQVVQQVVDRHYPSNSPADWYVLAAGDGDDMNGWLKGKHMKTYGEYMPSGLAEKVEQSNLPDALKTAFMAFSKKVKKRMGPATYNALSRALLDFSNQLVPYLTEQRYAGRLIYGGGDDVLAYTNLWEWDNWLWDIRQCFRGEKDPEELRIAQHKGFGSLSKEYFKSGDDYWHWQGDAETAPLPKRPLFTMSQKASISFGVVIAHNSVPLAIALESLWEAEAQAKKHAASDGPLKDAVQVRVRYGNGNQLISTSKFDVFNQWRSLLTVMDDLEPSLFEQAASVWQQHPAPIEAAIKPWVTAFCDRRDFFAGKDDVKDTFAQAFTQWLEHLWQKTKDDPAKRQEEIVSWLKLAAFILRKRHIKLPGEES